MIVIIIKFIIFLVFLFLAALFSAAETAITSINNANTRRIKEKYNKLYKFVSYWEKNPEDVITTLLVLMNMSVVAVGISATSLGYDVIDLYNLNKAKYIGIFPVFSIILTLVFGNLLPKTFSRYKAEFVAIKTLPLVIYFTKLAAPINVFLVSIANFILELFGRQTHEPKLIQPDEVEFLLSNENISPLSSMSRSIVNRIIEFRKTKINQVMVPISDILAVNIEQPKEKFMKEIISTQFSRVPIYKGTINNIIGIINAKDIAMAWRNGEILAIEDLIRPVHYVPETAYVKQLLIEFRKGRHHMSIVVDEFGSTIGLVTMEDLLEEIVGEVWDEYDEKDKNIIELPNNRYLIKASVSIADVNEQLNFNIPEESFSTMNGWVLDKFGYIPKKYEKFVWNNLEVEVETVDDRKVRRILVKKRANVL